MKRAEFNEKMIQRIEELKQATYQYLQALLEMRDEEMREKGLWNERIFQEILGAAVNVLSQRGFFICNPYIFEEFKIPYLCTLAECRCKECTRQDEFMHRERMYAYIEDILEGAGFNITCLEDSITVSENVTGDSFVIRITVPEGKKSSVKF